MTMIMVMTITLIMTMINHADNYEEYNEDDPVDNYVDVDDYDDDVRS